MPATSSAWHTVACKGLAALNLNANGVDAHKTEGAGCVGAYPARDLIQASRHLHV